MTERHPLTPDPELDLILERTVDVPPSVVWAAWTQPEHLVHRFTPSPRKPVSCEIDLQPGDLFRTATRGPEGEALDQRVGHMKSA